ncbi:DUF4845 domain-containing protein [Curvibacter sp. RS43]|uniref:DUF4845 domain-containing protein n=1 Tax=Curvibacter microcysteis TaxID=3026419 RepID=UPI00236120FC|nr:DUF4845 domain-containing protein [Curvibacter sp. RS43]MDD0810707.1 DUF4845 domain-containing protein [Curvibacter sp. RS43]
MKQSNRAPRSQQRGLSFISLVLVAALIVSTMVVTAQVVPTGIEYVAAKKAIERAKAGSTVLEVQQIFDRAAAIDDISSISGKDLDIRKVGDKVVVGFAYTREIHLVGPAYLVMKYSAQTN